MTNGEIIKAASGNTYVNQLCSVKGIYGPQATIGIVTGPGCNAVDCATVADLVAAGCGGEDLLYLDQEWQNLSVLYPPKPEAERIADFWRDMAIRD